MKTNQNANAVRRSPRYYRRRQLLTIIHLGSAVLIIALVVALIITAATKTEAAANTTSTENAPTVHISSTAGVSRNDVVTKTDIPTVPSLESDNTTPDEQLPEAQPIYREYLGEFTITYYCGCEKCCGKWGKDRPKVDGKTIVFTATGAIAQEGITVAVDPNKIPYGTTLYIDGIGYRVAQDCGGAIKGNKIDVYMNKHSDALEAGIHTADVYLVLETE